MRERERLARRARAGTSRRSCDRGHGRRVREPHVGSAGRRTPRARQRSRGARARSRQASSAAPPLDRGRTPGRTRSQEHAAVDRRRDTHAAREEAGGRVCSLERDAVADAQVVELERRRSAGYTRPASTNRLAGQHAREVPLGTRAEPTCGERGRETDRARSRAAARCRRAAAARRTGRRRARRSRPRRARGATSTRGPSSSRDEPLDVGAVAPEVGAAVERVQAAGEAEREPAVERTAAGSQRDAARCACPSAARARCSAAEAGEPGHGLHRVDLVDRRAGLAAIEREVGDRAAPRTWNPSTSWTSTDAAVRSELRRESGSRCRVVQDLTGIAPGVGVADAVERVLRPALELAVEPRARPGAEPVDCVQTPSPGSRGTARRCSRAGRGARRGAEQVAIDEAARRRRARSRSRAATSETGRSCRPRSRTAGAGDPAARTARSARPRARAGTAPAWPRTAARRASRARRRGRPSRCRRYDRHGRSRRRGRRSRRRRSRAPADTRGSSRSRACGS